MLNQFPRDAIQERGKMIESRDYICERCKWWYGEPNIFKGQIFRGDCSNKDAHEKAHLGRTHKRFGCRFWEQTDELEEGEE
jgi:hypothetical protein